MTEHFLFLAAASFVVALLYSSVGHPGASGYIAVMTLFGLGVEVVRPTALALNILVAAIGFIQWWRGGHFVWALFWPFALLSVPAAFLGGWLTIPAHDLKILIGLVLWFSAWRLFCRKDDPPDIAHPPRLTAIASGAGIGFLSGLAGHVKSGRELPDFAWPLVVVVAIGGFIGSRLGSRHLPSRGIAILLAVVLVIRAGPQKSDQVLRDKNEVLGLVEKLKNHHRNESQTPPPRQRLQGASRPRSHQGRKNDP
jgi:uncharacterized membrane protein YfcA